MSNHDKTVPILGGPGRYGDMQWRRRDGSVGTYRGPLYPLGYGIPRARHKSWGVQRALFDLAFGYTSGFPVRDILPFAARSLFPRRPTVITEADIEWEE